MRPLSSLESTNLQAVHAHSSNAGLLAQTRTTIGKSATDATEQFRRFLADAAIHDFSIQAQGPIAKVTREVRLSGDDGDFTSEIAFYRPTSGRGDPRVRITRIADICRPGDILVVILLHNTLWAARLSDENLPSKLGDAAALSAPTAEPSAAFELAQRLEEFNARGYLRCQKRGPGAVGHLLESLLGIPANSSKSPDYNGVEIKTRRESQARRHTILAKSPKWSHSPVTSTSLLLDLFGYYNSNKLELNCEVGKLANSAGLSLGLSECEQYIEERSTHPIYPVTLRWDVSELGSAILKKHAETFWVTAKTEVSEGIEYALFTEIVHTRGPNVLAIPSLVRSGDLTVDHLCSQQYPESAKEKGPLFKVSSVAFSQLFPTVANYRLGSALTS